MKVSTKTTCSHRVAGWGKWGCRRKKKGCSRGHMHMHTHMHTHMHMHMHTHRHTHRHMHRHMQTWNMEHGHGVRREG